MGAAAPTGHRNQAREISAVRRKSATSAATATAAIKVGGSVNSETRRIRSGQAGKNAAELAWNVHQGKTVGAI